MNSFKLGRCEQVRKLSVLCTAYLGLGLMALHAQASFARAQATEPVAPEGAVASEPAKEASAPTVKSGVAATSGILSGSASIVVDGGEGAPGDEQSPVGASIQYAGKDCVARIINLTDKFTYDVSFAAEGYRGLSKAFSRFYSVSVKPKETVERTFDCEPKLALKLNIKSAKGRKAS